MVAFIMMWSLSYSQVAVGREGGGGGREGREGGRESGGTKCTPAVL